MSIKTFHIFFIVLSTTLCFGTAVVFLTVLPGYPLITLLSLFLGVGLIAYGIMFFKKLTALQEAK